MMIISGTTRTVVKRRMLPRWLRSHPSFIARLPSVSSATELDRLNVLPGNVDATPGYGAPKKGPAEVHVVGLHAGSVRQEDGSRGADVGVGEVRRERAILDGLPGERQRRDAGHRDLGSCTAAVNRDLLRLPVALDRVRCLAAEEPVQSHEGRVDGLTTEDSEAELAHTAELADSGTSASGGALSLAF